MKLQDYLENVHSKIFQYRMETPAIDYYKFIADINAELATCDDYKEGIISFSTLQTDGRQHFIHHNSGYYTIEETYSIDVEKKIANISFKIVDNEEIDMNLENKLYQEAEQLGAFLHKFKDIRKHDVIVQSSHFLVSKDLMKNRYNSFYNIAPLTTEIQQNTFITLNCQHVEEGSVFAVLIDYPAYIKEYNQQKEKYKLGYVELTRETFTDSSRNSDLTYEIGTGQSIIDKPMYQLDGSMYVLYSIEKLNENIDFDNVGNISNSIN